MNWKIRPSDHDKEKMNKLKIIFVLIVFCSILYAVIFRSIVFPILGLAVVGLSTAEFFLGKSFRLDDSVAKAGAAEISWQMVKSVHVKDDLIYLSPFESESKLDAFRGVKLIIQNVSRESVLDYVRKHVGKDVRFLAE